MKRFLSVLLAALFLFPVMNPRVAALEIPDTAPEPVSFISRINKVNAVDLPASYGSFPTARGQATDYLAWAFAACEVLEAASRVSFGTPISFSPNHMRYALSADGGNSYGFQRSYTAAGSRSQVAAYLMRSVMAGPVYTANDPYSAGISAVTGKAENARTAAETNANTRETRAEGVIFIPDEPRSGTSDDHAAYNTRLKEHIYKYGAVTASIYFDYVLFNNEYYRFADQTASDHSIALVGWDDNYKYNVGDFIGYGAFLVTDSAINDGRGGVYYLTYDTVIRAAYTVTGLTREMYEKTYEYDYFGVTALTGFSDNTAYYSAVYAVTGTAETLRAVTFFAAGEDTRIEIYLARFDSDTSAALSKAITGSPVTLSGGVTSKTYDLPGYYTVSLENEWPVGIAGGKFAVIIKAYTPYETSQIPLQSISYGGKASAGQGFISASGDKWIDAYGNNRSSVCIKAHVTPDADIPLESVAITAPEDSYRLTPNGQLPLIVTAPGKIVSFAPKYEPSNATDVLSTEWYIGNADADEHSFTEFEEDSGFNLETLKFKASKVETFSVRCEITTNMGITAVSTVIVEVSDIPITEIVLDKTEVTIKTSASTTLKYVTSPEDATLTLNWFIARDAEYTPYAFEYDERDPYREGSPIATVSDTGKVTPVAPGICYVYAVSSDGAVRSDVCKVTIEEVALTGTSISKKTLTLTQGALYTLRASTKPTNASYKDFSYSSSDVSVLRVDAFTGTMEAVSPGIATFTATCHGQFSVSCTVTVTDKPYKTSRINASFTVTPYGYFDDIDIIWSFADAPESDKLYSPHFKAEVKSKKIKITSTSEGSALLIAEQYKETDGENRLVWSQSFRLEAVRGAAKLKIADESGEQVKKLVISIDENDVNNPAALKRSNAIPLNVSFSNPDEATELAYAWQIRNSDIAELIVDNSNPKRVKATIIPLKAGTTKLTVTNYNGNKKASVTIKIVYYPKSVTINKDNFLLIVGKKTTINAKVDKGAKEKLIKMVITDGGGNQTPHSDDNPIATITDKGRLTALRPGNIVVIAYGAPYDERAAKASVNVYCHIPLSGVSFARRSITMSPGTSETVIYAPKPQNTTQTGFFVTSDNPSVATAQISSDGEVIVYAHNKGKTRIIMTSSENARKKAAINVTVKQ